MRGRRARALWLALLLAGGGLGVFGLEWLSAHADATLRLELEPAAIGARTEVRAIVRRDAPGIAGASLTLEQGARSLVLDRFDAEAPLWRLWRSVGKVDFVATVGDGSPPWLEEGEVVLKLVASPRAGPLRRSAPTVLERRVAVRLGPPELQLLSDVSAPRGGASGLVTFRVGSHVVASGLEVAGRRIPSHPAPDAGEGVRFVFLALPHDFPARDPVMLFAEDDAGNRRERALFETRGEPDERRDTIGLDSAFLERVVPPIVARISAPEPPDDPLGRYLWLNRELRAQNRAAVAEIARSTAPAFLWRGPFLGLARAVTTGRFGDLRTYTFEGKEVDRQTHLGLDLASVAQAPVIAPNAGKVLFSGFLGIYGNAVIIDHGFGLTSLLAHMSRLSVEAGQWVARGQEVGRTGATGLAGGDHLHLGLFVNGVAVDPEPWLDPSWVGGPVQEALSRLDGTDTSDR